MCVCQGLKCTQPFRQNRTYIKHTCRFGSCSSSCGSYQRWRCACMMNKVLLCCRYGNDMHTKKWSWLTFFGIQGIIVGLEGVEKKLMTKRGFTVPHWLATCITVSLQMWLAHALFFPALTDARLPVKLRGALVRNYHNLVGVVL